MGWGEAKCREGHSSPADPMASTTESDQVIWVVKVEWSAHKVPGTHRQGHPFPGRLWVTKGDDQTALR